MTILLLTPNLDLPPNLVFSTSELGVKARACNSQTFDTQRSWGNLDERWLFLFLLKMVKRDAECSSSLYFMFLASVSNISDSPTENTIDFSMVQIIIRISLVLAMYIPAGEDLGTHGSTGTANRDNIHSKKLMFLEGTVILHYGTIPSLTAVKFYFHGH